VVKTWFLSAISVVVILVVAMARYALGVTPGQLAVAAPFFLAVVLIAAVWGRGPAVVAGLSSALLFNYLIIPPPNALSPPTADEGILVFSLLAVALIVGTWKERTLRVERQMRELAASENLRKTLLDTIAHDFKTPLTAIVGSLSSLRSEGRWLAEGDRRELIETAYEEATRLTRSINDVLEMTRLDGGAVRLRREPTPVRDLVQQARSQVREAVGERPCTVTIPPDVPAISTDGVLVSHALANLLENAAKYSSPNAPIDVEADAVDGHVVIAVSDRGIGVSQDEADRIFERFYRPKREEVVPLAAVGTGLGLAIAKGIVEAHGGRVWAEQRAGGGVVVKLRLPVAANE
jgi:two-component system sensor histidine kinase KdpD